MNLLRLVLLAILSTVLFSCSSTDAPAWKGKLYYGYVNNVKSYDFANKQEKILFDNATQPFITKGGDIYFVNDKYQKRNQLIRKSNASFMQFKDVLDMSSENPDYKQQLDDYSVIRGTGISAVLDRMSDPKVSPNGKYLSVTIIGYKGQAFENNCVGVFDLATGKLVTKFENKYYGSWTPDNRLVMSGSHKSTSVNDGVYSAKTPGIFISDAALQNITRIDPDLDDPTPYHAAVSPDGKRVAFILNNHVWVMNINGKNLKQLTDVDRDNIETFPAWSPDGQFIAAWSYKTFEKSYFTAIAIVPSNATKPVALTDKAAVWPRDTKGYRLSGGSMQLNWK
jgi:Tol biopolymer transport system component